MADGLDQHRQLGKAGGIGGVSGGIVDDGDRPVVFVISFAAANKSGIGGSFQDVRALSLSLPSACIVVLGHAMPLAFSPLRNVLLCEPTRDGIRRLVRSQMRALGRARVVHAYDQAACILGSWLAIALRVPLVATKPGGGREAFLHPFPANLVVLQKKDYERLMRRWLLPPRRVACIANRILRQGEATAAPARSPFERCGPGRLKLLCIARIATEYREQFGQAIALARRLEAEGLRPFLALVGERYDAEVVDFVTAQCVPGEIETFTDRAYFDAAYLHIRAADVCIGAGRVLMESLGEGKPVFFSVAGAGIPCFLDQDTYDRAFENNFSGRTSIPGHEIESRFALFLAMLRGQADRDRHEQFMRRRFTEDLDARSGALKLTAFYASLRRERILNRFLYFSQHVLARVVSDWLIRPIRSLGFTGLHRR